MTKYEPLEKYLRGRTDTEVLMRFSEIEGLIGTSLPASAFKYPAWWSNSPTNNVMTHAWLRAGYRTERVDLGAQRLVFRRSGGALAPPSAVGQSKQDTTLSRLRAALGGSVRIIGDLTAPTGEAWDADRS
jgi:hypothetical protein